MKLYIYDHCPYCTKARMIFGYTNTNVEVITLLNDDEETPIGLINQKMVPILVDDENQALPESLDIISKINSTAQKSVLHEANLNEKLSTWLTDSRQYLYKLAMPRWVKADLKEFKTQSAIDYFTKKKEDYIGPFKDHIENTQNLLDLAHSHLLDLNKFIDEVQESPLSLHHINLYANLRCLTIVKEIEFPDRVLNFMKTQEEASKVAFHTPV